MKIYTFFSLTARLQLKYFEKGWVYIVFPQKMIRAEVFSQAFTIELFA